MGKIREDHEMSWNITSCRVVGSQGEREYKNSLPLWRFNLGSTRHQMAKPRLPTARFRGSNADVRRHWFQSPCPVWNGPYDWDVGGQMDFITSAFKNLDIQMADPCWLLAPPVRHLRSYPRSGPGYAYCAKQLMNLSFAAVWLALTPRLKAQTPFRKTFENCTPQFPSIK